MKLLRLKVGGFGPLQGEWSFAPDRVNLVVDENERGKSSLLAAVAAALYGLEEDKRSHRVLTPVERWRPWSGSSYRVELECEVGGERYSIARDFERDTVSVFNRGGKEITNDFREGKDQFPIGKRLLGVDSAEFEKCALVRQGDLDQVVPGDERARRGSTLRARLENAADTHIGDTNATEALRVLDEATRKFTSPELEFTGTVESAIERLEAKRGLLEADYKTLEHDVAAAAAPLAELSRLADEEHRLKETLRRLESERHEGLASEIRRQLAENDRALEDLAKLKQEAASLAPLATLPSNAEAELRETVARHEEAIKNLETLETRRREEVAKERKGIEAQLMSLKPFGDYSDEDRDLCIQLAGELRRMALDDTQLRQDLFELRDELAGSGVEQERIQFLTGRFATLPDEQQRLLRQQADANLAYQTEVAALEQERTHATEMLRDVDAARNARRVPGWFMLSLGLGAAGAGVLALALRGPLLAWAPLLGGGLLCAAVGLAMLALGARAQAAERDVALKRLSDAQRRLNQLRSQRTETEIALGDLSRRMGYRDVVDLMREWQEFTRVLNDSAPLVRAQEQIGQLEERRKQVLADAQPLMRAAADGPPSPEELERIAYEVKRTLSAKDRLAQLNQGMDSVEQERLAAEGATNALRERALRILQNAGIAYEPTRGWNAHIEDLAERLKSRNRHTLLVEELIPYGESRLLPEADVEQRRRHLAVLETGRDPALPAPSTARPQEELEAEVTAARARLDAVQTKRGDLRVQLEETWRKTTNQRPEIEAQLARTGAAIERTQRFRQSIELAKGTIQQVAVDTHRRWADFLNVRVAELLGQFGVRVNQLRFGEDLDFSVQMDEGPQVTRGKAHLQLSSGARDQLYLAVRLAISEYLSKGREALPLLIDDAFATSDDQRLRAAMRALIDGFGNGHQIVLLTCHRGRHEELRRLDPQLYGERVHWVEVRPGATTKH